MSAPVYRWVPGMRAIGNDGDAGLVVRLDSDGDPIVCWEQAGGDIAAAWASFCAPDLDHGPTRGALLDHVRELSGDPCAYVRPVKGMYQFAVMSGRAGRDLERYGEGDTEGVAILNALERLAAKAAAAQLDAIADMAAQRDALSRVVNRIRTLFDLTTLGTPAARYDETVLDETIEAVRTAARNADRVEASMRGRDRSLGQMNRLLATERTRASSLEGQLADARRKLADAEIDDPRATLGLYGWMAHGRAIWTRGRDAVTVERGVVTGVTMFGLLVSDELRAVAALCDEQMENNS